MRPSLRQLAIIPVILLLLCCFSIPADGSQDAVSETGDLGYDSLEPELKTIYSNLGAGIDKYSSKIRLTDGELTIEDYQIVLYAYQSDHPEKFWASYFTAIDPEPEFGSIVKYAVLPAGQTFPGETAIKQMAQKLEDATSSISISGGSMGERIKNLQKAIIDSVSYREDTSNAGNVYGAFVEKQCKCDGYSLAVSYLCKKNGINSLCVIGYIKEKGADTGGHAWNIIQMDNSKWYYLDATWDDVSNYFDRYDYFLLGAHTSTPTGSIHDSRAIFFDYKITVSDDRYDYDPLATERMIIYVAIAVVAIVLIILVARAVIKSRRARAEPIEDVFKRYEVPDGQDSEKEKEEETRDNNG